MNRVIRTLAARAAMGALAVVLGSAVPRAGAGEGTDLLERARQLAKTDWSWSDRRQTLELRIVDERGNVRERKLTMLTRREAPGVEKSLAVFLEPSEVRGTGFLQHVPATGASSQWLFLPDLGRARQITSKGRTKSFVGSDFSYADLDILENALHWTEDEAEARPVSPKGAEDAQDRVWFELAPTDEDRVYESVRVQLSATDVTLRAMEMYASADAGPVKMLRFEEIEKIDGVPTARRLEMSRPDRGTRTIVAISDVQYDSGLREDAFTKRALERGLDHVD